MSETNDKNGQEKKNATEPSISVEKEGQLKESVAPSTVGPSGEPKTGRGVKLPGRTGTMGSGDLFSGAGLEFEFRFRGRLRPIVPMETEGTQSTANGVDAVDPAAIRSVKMPDGGAEDSAEESDR